MAQTLALSSHSAPLDQAALVTNYGAEVNLVGATDKATFEQFCSDTYSQISNALGWALGNHSLGVEAADEAYTRAVEQWDKLSVLANPSGWVYRVGLNWAKRRIWRHNKEAELLAKNFSPETTLAPATYGTAEMVSPDLYVALSKISLKNRSVVVARHLLGYSEKQTAEALNISIGTVKSRSNRGLKDLKSHLGPDYYI